LAAPGNWSETLKILPSFPSANNLKISASVKVRAAWKYILPPLSQAGLPQELNGGAGTLRTEGGTRTFGVIGICALTP
jgi:hypothetical protein